jgi:GntR family transcriptional regulator
MKEVFLFAIDSRSPIPVYEQLKRQIRLHIASGRLRQGDRLPSIRELATFMRINPNTVAKVYGQLEYEGFVTSRAGSGVFVTADSNLHRDDRARILFENTDEYIASAVGLGFSSREILAILADKLEGEPSDDPDR